MGLFDKKFCDVCGEKIGLLGNRKLEDGNLCKDCARKLSPFFDERRHSTVEQIKEQLAYREQNKANLANFHPTATYGFDNDKVYVDMNAGTFIVTDSDNWREANPDIIQISQVTSAEPDIDENRDEIYYEDNDGNSKSYTPPRYEYEYTFKVKLTVNSPWFDDITIELTGFSNRPDSNYSEAYRRYDMEMNNIIAVLTGRQPMMQQPMMNQPMGQPMGYNQPMMNQTGYNQPIYNQPMQQMAYNQPMGYAQQPMGQPMNQPMGYGQPMNQGYNQPMNQGYNQPMGQQMATVRCDKCGWVLSPGQPVPPFCPNCGDKIDYNDMR